MKDRLVFWGTRDEDTKVLITVDLQEDTGAYTVQVMNAADVTEEFDNLVRNQWRNNSDDVVFPEVQEEFTRELSLTQSMLPVEYKVDRDDLLKMAQAEWNFLVLSKRLKNTYSQELEELEELAGQLEEFSHDVWNNMKNFWSKVQVQIQEKNLARHHGYDLRKRTNDVFGQLKKLRSKTEKLFVEESATHKAKFMDQLDSIEKKIEEGQSLRPLFEELKKIQRNFKNYRFSRQDHSAVWNKLDGLFKKIKTKKYGKSASGNDPLVKTMRRVEGLNAAIDRMKKSIKRDQKDLDFQKNRIEKAEGQLEAQLRQAKLIMLEERINSKDVKLQDMLNTEKTLSQRVHTLKQKAQEEKAKEEQRKEEQKIKERIATEIKEQEAEMKNDPEIQKAAAILAGSDSKTDADAVQESVSIIRAVVTASRSISTDEEE